MTNELAPDLIKDFVIASHFNLDKVKTLLEQHPSLLMVNHQWGENDYEDGLGAASHVGNRAIAEFFLAKGVPPTIFSSAMLGNLEEVRRFVDSDGTLANGRGAHRIPVMFHAAMSGNTELTEFLRSRGSKEGFNESLHGAISYAPADKKTAMVEWLLTYGATELLVKDYQGKTPLQNATERDLPEIITLLRKHGATE
jgi:uncharacterized protein